MPRVFERNGKWYYDIIVDSRRIKRCAGTSRHKAERALAEMEMVREDDRHAEHLLATVQRRGAGVSLVELRRQFLKRCAAVGRRASTMRNYRALISEFISVVGAKTKAHEVRPQAAMALIEALQARRASPRRINHALTATGTMFNWAVREGHLARNPLKNAHKVEHHDIKKYRALEDDEIRRLLKASKPKKRRAYNYGRIWIALLSTGLRLNQLVNLRWGDIDFARRQYRLLKNNTKNKKEYRQPISDEFEAVLREIAAEHKAIHGVNPPREQHVFLNAAGNPWRNNLLVRFRRCCDEAGIEHHRVRPDGIEEVVCIHSLRVTFATLLADAAVPVKAAQELMQHSSVELTLGLYAKARDRSKQAAVDGLRLLDRGKTKPRVARRRIAAN